MSTKELAAEWADSGVSKGDTLLVHSSLKRTLKRYLKADHPISPQIILESFLEAVGPTGTLLLPLFNFDFTKGTTFDIRKSPSQMGALTEVGRLYPGAVRTGHPIYSFAVIGKNAERFRSVNNFSGYGGDSPFAILRELDAKIASLDLDDQNSMTFYHHVEELHDVPYRFHKQFTANYVTDAGVTEQRTYGLFVRNLDLGVRTHVNPASELIWAQGLYSGSKPETGTGLRVISARRMFEFVAEIIKSGRAKGLLYRIEGENE